jgi:hypothetical protein
MAYLAALRYRSSVVGVCAALLAMSRRFHSLYMTDMHDGIICPDLHRGADKCDCRTFAQFRWVLSSLFREVGLGLWDTSPRLDRGSPSDRIRHLGESASKLHF